MCFVLLLCLQEQGYNTHEQTYNNHGNWHSFQVVIHMSSALNLILYLFAYNQQKGDFILLPTLALMMSS